MTYINSTRISKSVEDLESTIDCIKDLQFIQQSRKARLENREALFFSNLKNRYERQYEVGKMAMKRLIQRAIKQTKTIQNQLS